MGPLSGANNEMALKARNIGAILSIELEDPKEKFEGFEYMRIHARDHEDENLLKHFDSCHDFIEKHRL